MNANSTSGIRATVAAHTAQSSAGQPGGAPAHRPGDQVAHYKGATLRTAFAMGRPGGMAKAMLAKLKPRPLPPGAGTGSVARPQAEALESALEHESGGRRTPEGPGEEVHGHRVHRRDGERDPRDGSSRDDDDPPQDDDERGAGGARPQRPRARTALRPPPAIRTGAGVLRADWAVAALASGGEPALQRALAARLFMAARGPGTAGWRRPWLGNVGAYHAAAGPGGEGRGVVRADVAQPRRAGAGRGWATSARTTPRPGPGAKDAASEVSATCWSRCRPARHRTACCPTRCARRSSACCPSCCSTRSGPAPRPSGRTCSCASPRSRGCRGCLAPSDRKPVR